jgi:chromosome segregation ATPase
MEVEYNTLVQEKKGWTLHFRELLTTSDLHDFEDDKKKSMKEVDVTPVVILRLLSNMQNKCASLLHTSGTLENKISELTSAQRRAVLQVQQVELDLTEKTNKVLQLENSNALLRQQAKLYEGEVMSLRSLLKTFDAEMLMFGNKKKRSRTSIESVAEQGDDGESLSEVSVLLKLKNQEIENLQRELDQQRKDGAEVLKKLSADVGALSSKRLVEYGCMVLYVESMLSF